MLIKIIANRGIDYSTTYRGLSTMACSRFRNALSCLSNGADGVGGRSFDGSLAVALRFLEGRNWPVIQGWLK